MSEATGGSNGAQHLQPADATVIGILLDAGVERLEFLHSTLPKVSVSAGVSVHRDELTRFVGEQIGAVIKEQRALEDEYDRLMEERKRLMLAGPEKKLELLGINEQVEAVKAKLRGANATLTRSLKENPNVRDNQNKLLQERSSLMGILAECSKSVKATGNYALLVERLKVEEQELNKLTAVKSRLASLEEEMALLEREIRDEKSKMKNEETKYLSEYKDMKEELDQHRVSADIELDYYQKRLQTQRESLRLALHSQQQTLIERNLQLKSQLKSEQVVQEQTKLFFQHTLDSLASDKTQWTDRVESQAKHLEETALPSLKSRKHDVQAELARLRLRKEREDRDADTEAQNLLLAKQAASERVKAVEELNKAAVLLQGVCRRFLASRDSGKKKKKKK